MSYAAGRLIHDADSHLMEMTDVLDPYFEKRLLARYHDMPVYKWKHSHADWVNAERARHEDAAYRAAAADAILLNKNYTALGSFRREDRPAAMDRLASPASWSSPRSASAISGSTSRRTWNSAMLRRMRLTG